MRKSTWQARYPEGQRKKPKTLSRTWVFTKSLLKKSTVFVVTQCCIILSFGSTLQEWPGARQRPSQGDSERSLSPGHIYLWPQRGQYPVQRWSHHGATVSSCKATSKIKNVNPHGRGQVDGEDEGSKGAGKVHLKTVSWVVAWNIILSFFVCLLWFNPILPSTSCHPSLPHLIHGPQKLSPNQTHIPTQNLLNLPKEHTLWRTSSSSSFSPDDLIFILTWCTLVSWFSQDDPYISFSLDEPLKTVFWIAKSWMATLKASVRWFSFLVIITRISFMKLFLDPKNGGNNVEIAIKMA